MSGDFGVLYVATGAKFIAEALESAASVKKAMPGLPIALITDDPAHIPSTLFKHSEKTGTSPHPFLDRVECLARTPFEKTLFLDTDTYIMEPVYELAAILDRFELAFCHSPYRWRGYRPEECPELASLPEAFPEPNGGVILYRGCDAVRQMLRRWAEIYRQQLEREYPRLNDQPAFRKAAFESTVNLTVLPPEYNLRTIVPYFAGGNAKVKILHGREPSLSRARHSINRKLYPRVGNFNSPSILRKMYWKARLIAQRRSP